LHALPSWQRPQLDPPQSTSVSSPSWQPSWHVGAAPLHTWLAQQALDGQSADVLHTAPELEPVVEDDDEDDAPDVDALDTLDEEEEDAALEALLDDDELDDELEEALAADPPEPPVAALEEVADPLAPPAPPAPPAPLEELEELLADETSAKPPAPSPPCALLLPAAPPDPPPPVPDGMGKDASVQPATAAVAASAQSPGRAGPRVRPSKGPRALIEGRAA
jgi:hypothetical protein